MSSRTLVYALLCAHFVSALRLGLWEKRDTPFIPQRVNIPLSFDSQGRYVATVSMGTDQSQRFNFTMTTQSGLTYVAGARCNGCGGVPLYNQSTSPSAKSFSSANSASIFGQSATASVIKEDCQLRLLNGTGWDYPNQTIVIVDQPAQGQLAQASDAQVGNGLSGLIGMATNKNPSTTSIPSEQYVPQFEDSIFGQWLLLHPTAVNFTFGMHIGPPLNIPRGNTSQNAPTQATPAGDPGTLHWLQPDASAYDPTMVSWTDAGIAPDSSSSPFANSSCDWYVNLDGWVLNAGDNHISNTRSVVATVDPLYTDLYLPQDQANLIHDAIHGSEARPDLASLPGLSQAWTVPCNSTFSYGITVGTQTFNVDQNTLVIPQPDGSCVSGIEAWTDASQTQYVLGARFLSTIYLIFNVPRDGSNQMGFAPRTVAQKSSNIGAIVGGTVGGVAFVVSIALAVYFCFYRHRRGAHRVTAAQFDAVEIEKPDEQGAIHPFQLSATTPTTVRFAHAPESTVGSDNPLLPSPPLRAHMLGIYNGGDFERDIAPPSYETVSEGERSASGSHTFAEQQQQHWPPSAHAEKANFAQGLPTGSNTSVAQWSPFPSSPTSNQAAAGTRSNTMYE